MNDSDRRNEGAIFSEPPGDEKSRFVKKRRSNVESDLIEITEDKLENILLKHLDKLRLRISWVNPLSVAVAVFLAKATATFHDAFSVKAAVWEAIFLLVGMGAVIWLAIILIRLSRAWRECSLDYIMRSIKNSQETDE